MREEPAPKVDSRSAQDVARQLRKLLGAYAPPWNEAAEKDGAGLGGALVGIFSRYAEIIIERLNKTPEKNLLAYLDMLGLSALPPQPARVPLTFRIAAGGLTDAPVPAGTQVAAKPLAGDAGPVIFETERELTVLAASLTAAFTRDPARDAFADQRAIINAPADAAAQVFLAGTPLEHAFYIGHDAFLGHPALKELHVVFELKREISNPKPRQLTWEIWDGERARWAAVAPKPADANAAPGPTGFFEDKTAALTKSGEVVFTRLPAVQPVTVGGVAGRWLRCRLTTPIPPSGFDETPTQPAQLPVVNRVTLTAVLERSIEKPEERLPADAAFFNNAPADTTKSFFPFGEKPRVGDTLYLAQTEAFSARGASVSINFSVTRPKINPVTRQPFALPDVTLAWEFWDGRSWAQLFTSYSNGVVAPAGQGASDTTNAFTQDGRVTFILPRAPVRTTVNGVENFWVRVRIASGDYGKEAYYTVKPKVTDATAQTPAQPAAQTPATPPPPDEYVLVPASFAPPTVHALGAGYKVTAAAEPPDGLLVYDDFNFEQVPFDRRRGDTPFEPFRTTDDTPVTLYVGFTLPEGRVSFPNRVVSLYLGAAEPAGVPDVAAPAAAPRLVWQYWNGRAWARLSLNDDTADLTRSGLLQFLAPPDFARRREFGLECYWVRVGWASGQYQFNPRVRALLLNTTTAAQTVTLRGENLGSSDASAGQKFTTTAAPVLAGQRLEVREPDRPSAEEWARIEAEEGPDAIAVTLDEMERPAEVWVRWHEVPDFYGSGARDRHYVVNHLTGEVVFGDGLNGMIPPRGAGNLRVSFYQTGGGSAGNRPAGTITELKTTVPYVDSVVNMEPSGGGADAETRDSLIRRGPRSIRHRDRAVTAQDYEDLAMMASSGVARVKCIPLQDIAVGIDTKQPKTGVVSLIVVPLSTDAKPYPDAETLDAVRSYLDRRRAADARLVIDGPEYIRVKVRAEVVPTSTEVVGRLEGDVADALARFLHPLTGGGDGAGWNFGRKPRISDLYAVIEGVAGVSYVRQLRLSGSTEAGAPVDFDKLTEGQHYFLVYSGEHEIELVFD